MFSFGDPATVSRMYLEGSTSGMDFDFEVSIDEMDENQLKWYLTHTRTAYRDSLRAYGNEGVSEHLLQEFDKTFWRLCVTSSWFRGIVLNERHSYIGGQTVSQRAKYRGMAMKAKQVARKQRRNPNPD